MELYDLVLNLVRVSGKQGFINDHRLLGQFFYGASVDSETADLLKGVVFNDSLGYPSSNQLDDVLQNLQLTGVIGRLNPMYMTNAIRVSPLSLDELKLTSPKEKKPFRKLLQRFKEELCRDDS